MTDFAAREALLASGWRVGVVCEFTLRGRSSNIGGVLNSLSTWLHSNALLVEERE